ncbi:hypothetical protein [Paraherbaspirillum soli]|uniref:Uncharacterized protein n=1 Tax=Paraherbaspirillum soli TaxID=631222 RepID=A0ABW0M8Y0_9BURK
MNKYLPWMCWSLVAWCVLSQLLGVSQGVAAVVGFAHFFLLLVLRALATQNWIALGGIGVIFIGIVGLFFPGSLQGANPIYAIAVGALVLGGGIKLDAKS